MQKCFFHYSPRQSVCQSLQHTEDFIKLASDPCARFTTRDFWYESFHVNNPSWTRVYTYCFSLIVSSRCTLRYFTTSFVVLHHLCKAIIYKPRTVSDELFIPRHILTLKQGLFCCSTPKSAGTEVSSWGGRSNSPSTSMSPSWTDSIVEFSIHWTQQEQLGWVGIGCRSWPVLLPRRELRKCRTTIVEHTRFHHRGKGFLDLILNPTSSYGFYTSLGPHGRHFYVMSVKCLFVCLWPPTHRLN